MHGVLRAFYMPAIAAVNREMVMKEGVPPQIRGQAAGRHLAEAVTFDIPLKKGISAKDRGENKSPHSEQHSAVSSFWFRYIPRMSVKQLGGLALRSLHTRAFPSGERAASGLLAGHGRRNSCLQVPGSLS